MVIKQQIPVTLFVYPSAISNARYAMTWQEIAELAAEPFLAIESHSYWHPNFRKESARRNHADYAAFIDMQLRQSKATLEKHVDHDVTLLAWPFGIYDAYLMDRASAAGYQAAFSIECRAAGAADPIMALPRCLVSDNEIGSRFLRSLNTAIQNAKR